MIKKNVWFMSSAGRGIDVDNVDVARDEPSHIHIARPSRLLQRDNSTSSIESTDPASDPAAEEVTAQAA
jgi:hypothetical protein